MEYIELTEDDEYIITLLTNFKFRKIGKNICVICNAIETPQWRKHRNTCVCNACGLRLNKKLKYYVDLTS